MKNETKLDVVRKYVNKYIDLAIKNNKSYSKRYIATVIFNENPGLYTCVESARKAILKVTHCSGSGLRERFKKDEEIAKLFALIPEQITEYKTDEPFIMPVANNKILAMADLHDRFYNRKAFEIAVERGIKNNCNAVFINGDLMDFYGFSKFDKNPNILSVMGVEDTREWVTDILTLLQDVFGYVVVKMGNHDCHRERAIMKKAENMPELMDYVSFENYISFDGSNVQVVDEHRHVKIGKLNAFHGHEYYGGGGIHVAWNRLHKAFDSVISAHSHKAQSVVKPDINGDIFGSWTLGCMCGLSPRYCPKNDWTNGFAIIETEASGDFEVQNMVIHGSKIFTI